MSGPIPIGRADQRAPRDERAALRKATEQLEGVFYAQLLQAMRGSVPDSGLLDEDPGRDMFQSLLDERVAALAAERLQGGVGESLYRQLEKRLVPEEGAADATSVPSAGTTRGPSRGTVARTTTGSARAAGAAAGARGILR
jgi:Rod binding domain-containing protein